MFESIKKIKKKIKKKRSKENYIWSTKTSIKNITYFLEIVFSKIF